LFRNFVDGLLLRCVNDEESHKLLHQIHGSSVYVIHIGGHFSTKVIAFEIIRNGYYLPSIFRDSYKFTRYCDKCQKIVGKERLPSMPLQPILPDFHFYKWGLKFIGPIDPPSSVGHIFTLTVMNYFIKWTKVVPLKHAQDEQIIFSLETNIFHRFGLPLLRIMAQPSFLQS